jgi:hypothetical protein
VQANDINENQLIVGEGGTLRLSGVGSCRHESCEIWEYYPVVWGSDCFGTCCGEATGGAGGAGGADSAGAAGRANGTGGAGGAGAGNG